MTRTVPDNLIASFSSFVAAHMGLHFPPAAWRDLERGARTAAADLGMVDAEEFVRWVLASPAISQSVQVLARHLTVGETYFFREKPALDALEQRLLPELIAARRNTTRRIRIWSAACCTGEEPYTLAIILSRLLPDWKEWDVRILGTDINARFLEQAAAGVYREWSFRATPDWCKARYFKASPDGQTIDPEIKKMVTFSSLNLATGDFVSQGLIAGGIDIIFCRNALMYFTQDQAIRAIQRIAYSLRPGGCFFLGHAETLRGLSEDFHLRHSGDAFYYQRKDAPPPRRIPRPARAPATAAPDHVAWVDVIRLASERVEALAGRASAFNLPTLPPGRRDLGPALDLMRRERFTEALVLLRELRPESGEDPEALLLEAMLLTNGGRFADAEEVCRRLLAVDGSNAGARCAMALCREAVGDPEGAAEHDRIAVHLDPGFAMPRLHLGLLARRAGERSVARQELGEALALLRREDAGRLLLFGGGFGRDALIALCRSALIECGGPP